MELLVRRMSYPKIRQHYIARAIMIIYILAFCLLVKYSLKESSSSDPIILVKGEGIVVEEVQEEFVQITEETILEEINESDVMSLENIISNINEISDEVISEENYFKAKVSMQELQEKYESLQLYLNNCEKIIPEGLQQQIYVAESSFLDAEECFYNLEKHEIHLLAKGIHGEGSICDNAEKYRIGTVIVNRLERNDFANTTEGVLVEGYSSYHDERWYNEEPSLQEYSIAEDILVNGNRVFPIEVVYQSQTYQYGTIVPTDSIWHVYSSKPNP